MWLQIAMVPLALAQKPQEPDEPDEPEVLAQIDWQGHPAMHLTWKFFGKGLTDRTPKMEYRHRFSQTAHAPYLEASGVRIFLMAAMAAEKARNPRQARELILSELAYVEDFVKSHSDGWALAKSPQEAREILRYTDKRVVVHAIEGGHLLLAGPEDARFWAEQGVALITLMHLRDDELGSAGILPMKVGPWINREGARRRALGERRGLTERGAQAIVELDQAGILVDFSHMSPQTVDDALAVTAAHGIAPVVTHGKLERLHHSDLAYRNDQVLEIYRQGGIFSLGLSPQYLDPVHPDDAVPPEICRSTVEMFAYHWTAVRDLVLSHAEELVGAEAGALTPEQRTRLAVGWSSDWNGWASHAAPVYGDKRCRPLSELPDKPSEFDTRGLAHPGLLPGHWEAMTRMGVDLEPMLRSAERFLDLWEEARQGNAPASAGVD